MKTKIVTILFLCTYCFFILSSLSCNQSQPINTLVFTTKWPVIPHSQWSTIISSLRAGNLSLNGVWVGGLTCDFITDYNTSPSSDVAVNGPDNAGVFNMIFSSSHLNGVQSLSSCIRGTNNIPSQVTISSAPFLVLDHVNKQSLITITFGNDIFTSDYSEFTPNSLYTANRSVTGSFQMFATNHDNPQDQRVLIVVNGSFSAKF